MPFHLVTTSDPNLRSKSKKNLFLGSWCVSYKEQISKEGKNYDYVTYWMNNLQKLDTEKEIFVTLGNCPEIDEERVFKKICYEHPLYSENTIEGQKYLKSIQGENNTYFVGAHLGYGFHEDGIRSSAAILKNINE